MRHIDFENIEDRFDKVLQSKEWKRFQQDFDNSSDIYIVANGGLWAVGNHAADDCTRLFAKAGIEKSINSLESQCLMTSIANDYGYNNLFISWLDLQRQVGKMKKDAMVVALSCSGGSKNVITCLHWAQKHGYKSALISGQPSVTKPTKVNEVNLDCKYFHTVEVLTLILFYELIHACGAKCPTIKDEVIRKDGSVEALRIDL